MKFVIDAVDGETMQDAGFSILFRQDGQPSILYIETDLSVPEKVIANPNPEGLQPADGMEPPHFSIEEEMAELDYLWSQLREIKYLIHEKERALVQYSEHQQAMSLKDCDSLKCVVRAVTEQALHAAHGLYGKVRGQFDDEEDEFGHPGMPHGKHSKFNLPFHRVKNHTCGPPKDGKANHTLPSPPWKRPHHRPLPFCRYPPPPPFHHGPPPPPPHGKPPGGSDDHDGPHHGPGNKPHHGMPPPDFDGPDHRPQGPPDFDSPPLDHPPPPPFDHPPPPEFQHEPGHMGPGPDGPPLPFPPSHQPFPNFSPGDPIGPHHNGINRPLQILKFTGIGFLFAFLILALHRRACTQARRADRQARREERSRRRACRRAAHKHVIRRILNRLAGRWNGDGEEEEYEEKIEGVRLLGDAEDGMSMTMSDDIREMRITADVVDEMVAADTRNHNRTQSHNESLPSTNTTPSTTPLITRTSTSNLHPPTPEHEHEEELPAYEDNDGSEMSSVIADGFRYESGREYVPTQSPEGSVSDILGDVKN